MFSAFRSLCTILLSCCEKERKNDCDACSNIHTDHMAHWNSAGGLPCAWLQTGPGKRQTCSPDLTGAPWCWFGRRVLPRWHTPSPSRVASASPPSHTSRLCWDERASACKQLQSWKGLVIARRHASYPGFSRLLSLLDEDVGGRDDTDLLYLFCFL